MAWPDPGMWASYDAASTSLGRALDPTLWDMMCARSEFISMVPREAPVNQKLIEWEYRQTIGRTVTEANSASTTIDGHATNTALEVTSVDYIAPGTILRNATRPTPIGTYGINELMEVQSITGNVLTVERDSNNQNSGNGSTAHALTDTYEILFTPVAEGSLAANSPNKYKAVGYASNYAGTQDFKIQVTGDAFAQGPAVARDNMQTQWDDRMTEHVNDLASMVLYSFQDKTAAAGSDSHVRKTKGAIHWLAVSGGNVDYTTTALTPTALNNLFRMIRDDGGSKTDPYVIVCSATKAQTISSFGEDKIRISQAEDTYGRVVTVYLSDLGFRARIIDEPMCAPSDLFVFNMKKLRLVPFRPYTKWEWGAYTAHPTGDDTYNLRMLCSHNVKCVDGPTAHAMMTKLSWT